MSVFGRGLPVWIFIVAAASVPAQVAQTPAYEQALSLVKGGDYSSAVPVLEKLIQTNPADLRARNLLGIALTGAGRPLEANKQFESLLKSNPGFLPALKNLAHNLLETGDAENAHQHFKRALDIAPADPAVHFGLAQIAFTNAQHAAAIGHYEKTNGLHLKDPLARIRYAASCAETGEREKAFGALVSFPKDAPPPLQFEAGVQLAKLEQYPEAVSRFELARSGSYDPSKTGYNLALAYLKSNNHEAAIRTAEETSKIAAAPELYSVLAQAYEKDGRTIDAYQALRTAIKLSPKDESPYLELVALCLNHENQELGLEIADIGVRLVPDSSRIRLQRGVIYALQSRFDDAAADFRAAVQLDPHAPLGYVAEALVLLRIDQVDRAIALLRHRVKTKPEDYLANWLLAESLTRQAPDAAAATEEEALGALERSIAAHGRMPQSRSLMGKLLLARGDAEGAKQHLEKSLELDPDSVTASYQLAQVYRKQGKTREANELFAKVKQAKQEDPSQFTRGSLLRIIRDSSPAAK